MIIHGPYFGDILHVSVKNTPARNNQNTHLSLDDTDFIARKIDPQGEKIRRNHFLMQTVGTEIYILEKESKDTFERKYAEKTKNLKRPQYHDEIENYLETRAKLKQQALDETIEEAKQTNRFDRMVCIHTDNPAMPLKEASKVQEAPRKKVSNG